MRSAAQPPSPLPPTPHPHPSSSASWAQKCPPPPTSSRGTCPFTPPPTRPGPLLHSQERNMREPLIHLRRILRQPLSTTSPGNPLSYQWPSGVRRPFLPRRARPWHKGRGTPPLSLDDLNATLAMVCALDRRCQTMKILVTGASGIPGPAYPCGTRRPRPSSAAHLLIRPHSAVLPEFTSPFIEIAHADLRSYTSALHAHLCGSLENQATVIHAAAAARRHPGRTTRSLLSTPPKTPP